MTWEIYEGVVQDVSSTLIDRRDVDVSWLETKSRAASMSIYVTGCMDIRNGSSYLTLELSDEYCMTHFEFLLLQLLRRCRRFSGKILNRFTNVLVTLYFRR